MLSFLRNFSSLFSIYVVLRISAEKHGYSQNLKMALKFKMAATNLWNLYAWWFKKLLGLVEYYYYQ